MTDTGGEGPDLDRRDEELALLRRQVELAEAAERERAAEKVRRGNRWLAFWAVVGVLAIAALIAFPAIKAKRDHDRNVCELTQSMLGSSPAEARDYCG
ncbi:hypothetical protein HF998_00750 [Cellulomonas hominis]|nr:hypothetical protein [Cellulomonas hominis]MBB5472483.1 hypothetical protein [Cellulomonas hominis]NKY05537.1 hypothetical protein [Cellulomonas hominis]